MRAGLLAFLCLSLFAFSGCRQAPRPEGRSAYEILEPETAAGPQRELKMAEQQELMVSYVAACRPKTFPLPVYPRRALEGAAATERVYLRVLFDENGRVSEVSKSPRRITIEGPFTADFHAAAEAAVRTWSIDPARNVYYRKGPNGERQYLRTEPLSEFVDVQFTFEATGRVL